MAIVLTILCKPYRKSTFVKDSVSVLSALTRKLDDRTIIKRRKMMLAFKDLKSGMRLVLLLILQNNEIHDSSYVLTFYQ